LAGYGGREEQESNNGELVKTMDTFTVLIVMIVF
jgi:hypothetical protein